jgi:hypothetical protein
MKVYSSKNGGGYVYLCQISVLTGFCTNGNKYTITSTGLMMSEAYDWSSWLFPWES